MSFLAVGRQTKSQSFPTGRRTRLSLSALLAGLCLLIAAPLLAVIAISIFQLTTANETQQSQSLQFGAKSLAEAVDAELRHYMGLAEILANSPTAREVDLTSFRTKAVELVPPSPDSWIVLSDVGGQQLVNTRMAADAPLPKNSGAALDLHNSAISKGGIVVSDILPGVVFKDLKIALAVPVFKDGVVSRVVSLALDTQHITKLIDGHVLSSDWIVGIIDSKGHYIARRPQLGAGELASIGWRQNRFKEQTSEFESSEGSTIVNANAQSGVTGWTIGVARKKNEMLAAMWHSVAWAVGVSLTLLLAAWLAAIYIIRKLSTSVQSFKTGASEVIMGRSPTLPKIVPDFAGVYNDLINLVAERRLMETKLLHNEKQLRLALQGGRAAAWSRDLYTGKGTWSPEAYDLLGLSSADKVDLTEYLLRRLEAQGLSALSKIFHPASSDAGAFSIDFQIRRDDGHLMWLNASGVVDVDHEGKPERSHGIIQDVTERKTAQEREQLLLREVNHRCKNLLSVVSSIVSWTAADADADYVRSLKERIQALALLQGSLIEHDWKVVPLIELVSAQVSYFGVDTDARIAVSGPMVYLKPAAAQSVAITLHELATNAAKYGALSVPNGRLRIHWHVETSFKPTLTLSWEERGGPPAVRPSRFGFGTGTTMKVLERSTNGQVSADYGSSGLSWQLTCDLKTVCDDAVPSKLAPFAMAR